MFSFVRKPGEIEYDTGIGRRREHIDPAVATASISKSARSTVGSTFSTVLSRSVVADEPKCDYYLT